MSEKRQFKRFDKKVKIAISGSDLFNYQQSGTTKNISNKGIALSSPVSIGSGKIRTCKITIPENNEVIETVIKVVWEKENQGEYLLGIKFIDLDEKLSNQIQKYLLDS
ncbi:MAG TPA: PilZ domain-containing protein [Spirochaetota bacterium]|nr:PilZ domain-containing protein [Spirochaetota bacterium]